MIDMTHKDVAESEAIEIDGIEFVKVTRCKDCKWHVQNGCEYLNLWMMHMDDWFCAAGERKEQSDEMG